VWVRLAERLAGLLRAGRGLRSELAGDGAACLTALASYVVAVGQHRDRAAFAALFVHFAPRLKTYFFRYATVDDTTAEELMQETMLLVWRKAALFDPDRAAVSTWVFSIARNLRVDAWRLQQRRDAVEDGADQLATDPAPGSDEIVASALREVALHRAIQGLPREQGHLLLLSYFEDRSHAEIASRVGLPLGTVKSRLRAALSRLRAAMDKAP
jgi:RNA polymerase sigma-70 factor (ECF subfamily)